MIILTGYNIQMFYLPKWSLPELIFIGIDGVKNEWYQI